MASRESTSYRDAEELPAGQARCQRCKRVSTIKGREPMGVHYCFKPTGEGFWIWLHYGDCMKDWYRRYWERMRARASAEWLAEIEKRERKAKRKEAA